MYNAVAVPKITYAADMWYTPKHKKVGARKNSGLVGITNRLASVQRMATLAITGAMHTTATDMLDLHAGIWPMDLMLHRVCHWAALRVASLPRSHPLHKTFKVRAREYIKTHRSLMHELVAILGIMPSIVETISPVWSAPAYEIKVRVMMSELVGDRGIAEIAEDEVQIFSDGSGQEGKVGAAVVMYKWGQRDKILRYSLGTLMEHTVFEADAVGVLMALHLLRSERGIQRATIRLDNQAVLGALSIRKPKPAQIIIDEIIVQIEETWQQARHPTFRLEIGWIKGHSRVEGNEKANQEAKKAAGGQASRVRMLPRFLMEEPLSLSTSALRQAFNAGLLSRWRNVWATFPRYMRISRIDVTMLSKGFHKLMLDLDRTQTSILMQFRTGHVLLQKHLFHINKASLPNCLTCHQEEESVHHFLFECMTWHHKRWYMGKELGSSAKAADCVLNTKKGVTELLRLLGKLQGSS